ncbi:TPA: hypothetical protein U1C28_001666 [Streptococcus suis]|nr:hypothetical protein [Streptococcus suis]
MGKRLYLDFNIRDRVYLITEKGQVFKGVVYKLESLPDDSYELYILVDSNKFDFEIKLHESEIKDIKVLEHNAIERGKTFNIGF